MNIEKKTNPLFLKRSKNGYQFSQQFLAKRVVLCCFHEVFHMVWRWFRGWRRGAWIRNQYLPTNPTSHTPRRQPFYIRVLFHIHLLHRDASRAASLKCNITRFLLLSRNLRANLTILMLALIFIPVKAVSGLIFGTFVRQYGVSCRKDLPTHNFYIVCIASTEVNLIQDETSLF